MSQAERVQLILEELKAGDSSRGKVLFGEVIMAAMMNLDEPLLHLVIGLLSSASNQVERGSDKAGVRDWVVERFANLAETVMPENVAAVS